MSWSFISEEPAMSLIEKIQNVFPKGGDLLCDSMLNAPCKQVRQVFTARGGHLRTKDPAACTLSINANHPSFAVHDFNAAPAKRAVPTANSISLTSILTLNRCLCKDFLFIWPYFEERSNLSIPSVPVATDPSRDQQDLFALKSRNLLRLGKNW